MATLLLINAEPEDLDATLNFATKHMGHYATIPFDWEPWETNLKLSKWRDLNVIVTYSGPGLTREARQWFDSIIDFGDRYATR